MAQAPTPKRLNEAQLRAYLMRVDPYALLGIEEAAMQSEVEKAYRKKSLRVHPDKVRDKPEEERQEAEETFKEISMARDLLGDEVTRGLIDAILLDRRRAAAPQRTTAARPSTSAWDDEESEDEPDSPPWNSRTYGTSSARFPTWASSSSSGTRPSSFPPSASRAPPAKPKAATKGAASLGLSVLPHLSHLSLCDILPREVVRHLWLRKPKGNDKFYASGPEALNYQAKGSRVMGPACGRPSPPPRPPPPKASSFWSDEWEGPSGGHYASWTDP